MRRLSCLALLALLSQSLLISTTAAQSRRGLLSQTDVAPLGLHRAWFTRVLVDPARGGIAHLRQHISSTRSYTVYEVVYEGGKLNFSERDLDRFGELLGQEGAQKLAQQKVDDLKRRQLDAKIVTQTIPEITLYVTTDRGLIQAIDAETGRLRWATEVGSPRYPSEAPAANDQYVVVVNGVHVFVLASATGEIVWQRGTRGAPGAGPALTDSFVFVPMVNGIVESYVLDDHRRDPAIYRSHGRAVVQPITTGNVVAWASDQGHLNVAEANRHNMLFRLETNQSIIARPTALPGNRLLAASTDGYVYCVHETSGALLWRFSTGAPIGVSPAVVGDALYVVTEEGTLFRLNAQSGEEVWWTRGVVDFVSASGSRMYGHDRNGRLVAIRAETGALSGSLATQTLDVHLVNNETDRIFIGTQRGVIQCLHEVAQEWPLIHVSLDEEPVAERRPRPRRSEPETPEAAEPADANPFGGGTDPFGGGTGTDPFGGGETETPEVDPFDADPFN